MSRKFTSSDKVSYVDKTASTSGTIIHDSNLNNIQEGILYNNDAIDAKAPQSTTYTKTEVDTAISTAISGVTQFDYTVVSSLPSTGVKGTIYLVGNSGTGQNVYDEYIYLTSSSTWEKIGTTEVDISSKEDKGECTINNTSYEVVISNTDAGQAGKIVFYVES